MGADLVVDHTADVAGQLRDAGIDRIDMVLSTAGTAANVAWMGEILRPYGHVSATDLAGPLDADPLVRKSVSIHTEMVFSKITSGGDAAGQGTILTRLTTDVTAGRLRPIVTTTLHGLTVETMRRAHDLVESGRTIGKVVLAI
jgi:NADPH2:quinone reductase